MHRPWLGRKFGAELEMTKRKASGAELTDAAIRAAIRPHTNRLNPNNTHWYKSSGMTWDMKTDATAGWELASPAMTLNEEGHNEEFMNVTNTLERLGAVCDHNCGTHVHFEIADYDWRDLQRLMILWVRYEPFFFSLQPINRRSKSFCAPLYRSEWDGHDSYHFSAAQAACRATNRTVFEREARRIGRISLNIGNFWMNGRIEVRLHSGTVNYHKIRHWVMLMSALIARPKITTMPEIVMMGTNRSPTGLSTEYICKQLGLLPSRFLPEVPQESIELAAWLEQRRQQFATRIASTPIAPTPNILPEQYLDSPRLCAARIGIRAGRGQGLQQWGSPGNSCHHPGITNRRGCAAHTEDWSEGRVFSGTSNITPSGMRNIRNRLGLTDVRQVRDDRS